MAVDLALPPLAVVVGTAAIDSINPCAIGVLILLITTLLHLSNDRKKMLAVGAIYISAVFLTYLGAGFGLLLFIQKLNIAQPLSWIVGSIVIVLGLIEIKDFFWYGKGITLAIPPERAKQIEQYIQKVTVPGAIFLGAFVAAVELPCTGGPYLAITTFLAKIGFTWGVFWMLVFYNFIFVLPLIVILGLAFFGVKTQAMQDWKNKQRTWMRLFIGLVMVALGIILILWANGVISIGPSIS